MKTCKIINGGCYAKNHHSHFLILTFIYSCSKTNENAKDLINKAKLLWDGKQYTDPKKAIEYLDKAIKLQPNYIEAYIRRGVAYKNIEQNQPTIEDFTMAIRLQPDNVLAYFNRGTTYSNLNQDKQAIDNFNEVIHLKPDYAEAYNNRGFTYLLQGNKEQGNKELGYPDVQKACELGTCKTLEAAKGRGLCR